MRIYSFNEVIGNQHCINMLKRGISQNTLPHFMIFYGTMGTGKSTCAEITALATTCKNTIDGSPCMKCASCKSNISAIQTGISSTTVSKINLGRFNSKADVEKMIKEIFILQSSERNCVYILEEAHSLPSGLQTSLLEEIDKLDEHTYIILCTTKLMEIIPELRSRAILFPFKRLTDKESKLLLDLFLKNKKVNMDPLTKTIILNYTKGIPRDTVKLTEFILDNNPTMSEIKQFMNYIDDSVYYNLFNTLRFGKISDLINYINDEIINYDLRDFIINLKDYYIRVFFSIEGDMNNMDGDSSDNEYLLDASVLFKDIDLFALGNIINKLQATSKMADFQYFLIGIFQFLHKRKVSDIVKNRNSDVVEQVKSATHAATETKEISENFKTLHTFQVDSSKKFDFGGGKN